MDAFGDSHCVTGVADVVQNHGEFVAAQAGKVFISRRRFPLLGFAGTRNGVEPPNGCRQTLANLDQQIISCSMAQTVVYDLKVIDIQQQHSELVVCMAPGKTERMLKTVKKTDRFGRFVRPSW